MVQKRKTDKFEETKTFSKLNDKSVRGIIPDEIVTKINNGNTFTETIEKYIKGEKIRTTVIKDLNGNVLSKGKLVWIKDIHGNIHITEDIEENFWSNHNKKSSVSRVHAHPDNKSIENYTKEDCWENGNPRQVVTAGKNPDRITVQQYDENKNLISNYSITRNIDYTRNGYYIGKPTFEFTTTNLLEIPGSTYNNGSINTSMPIVPSNESSYSKWSDITVQFDGVLNSNIPNQHTKISGSYIVDSENDNISELNNRNITHITLNTRNYETTSGNEIYTEPGQQKQFNLKYNADTNTTEVFTSDGKSFVINGQVSNLAEFVNAWLKQ